ncbi:MAG: hypothetical protein VX570_06275, partial [Pseudomonadota bacterium]|nr:hypothetical protein [Pseudomonadota bacterium]
PAPFCCDDVAGKGHPSVNQVENLIVELVDRSAQIGQFIGHRWQWVGNRAAHNRHVSTARGGTGGRFPLLPRLSLYSRQNAAGAS